MWRISVFWCVQFFSVDPAVVAIAQWVQKKKKNSLRAPSSVVPGEDLLKGPFQPEGQGRLAKDMPPHFIMWAQHTASPKGMSHPYTHYQVWFCHASSKQLKKSLLLVYKFE